MLLDKYGNPLAANKTITKSSSSNLNIRNLLGGRLTKDRDYLGASSFFTIMPPEDPEESWQLLNLDEQTLSKISSRRLMELLANLSPEVNRALWDFLRFCNPGWEITASKKSAQKIIDTFIGKLDKLYGSFDIILARVFTGCFLRGGIFLELVLNQLGTEVVDLAVIDPSIARFRRYNDPVRGMIWELGQYQYGKWVSFEEDETVIYTPLDPMPESPYGRPLISASLFASVFLLGLLHDLRRVIGQQGYPRLDISVDLEKLKTTMPLDLINDQNKLDAWVQQTIREISRYYEELEPDDAFVHTDAVEVNATSSVAASLGGIETIIRFVERMLIRSLKSTPILMASNESVTETHADRQWEIHMAGIRSVQKILQGILERLFKLLARINGIQTEVKIKFKELDASESLKRAMAEYQLTLSIIQKIEAGLITVEDGQAELKELTVFREMADLENRKVPSLFTRLLEHARSANEQPEEVLG